MPTLTPPDLPKLDKYRDRLTYLMRTVPAPSGGRLSFDGIAKLVAAKQTVTGELVAVELYPVYRISAGTLKAIAKGENENPQTNTELTLAAFFRVSRDYWTGERAREIAAQYELVVQQAKLAKALQTGPIAWMAARAAELTPQNLRAVLALMDHLHQAQGDDPADRPSSAPGTPR